MTKPWRTIQLYTVGHSTRTLDELVGLLQRFGVVMVADIRTVPRSRHNPQFNSAVLAAALQARGLRYVHLPRLGGLRRPRKDSPNAGWRNASFRGFADYMLSEDFEAGLVELRSLATDGRTALMCAEAVPWRCHRSLIADALAVRGARVEHITGASRATPHHLTPFAQVEGLRITYPEREGGLVVTAPFHLEATVRVLQRRPTSSIDVWEEGYQRVLDTAEGLVLVEVKDQGTVDAPALRYSIRAGSASAATHAELEQALRRILGLDVDPQPLQRLAKAERALRPTARALRGMRPPRFAGLFEAFANVVPFQQVSLDSGVATVGRLVERFGQHLKLEGRFHHSFPSAERVAGARISTLRDCGMSWRKAEALHQLAKLVASGELSEGVLAAMSTKNALSALVELPGIGAWSAGLVLLRGLGRLDVFPSGDVGVARGLSAVTGSPPGTLFDHLVERFGERRGYLYFCVLGSALLAKGLIHPAPQRRL